MTKPMVCVCGHKYREHEVAPSVSGTGSRLCLVDGCVCSKFGFVAAASFHVYESPEGRLAREHGEMVALLKLRPRFGGANPTPRGPVTEWETKVDALLARIEAQP